MCWSSGVPGPWRGRGGPWVDGRTSNLTLTDPTVWWLKVAAVAAAWHSLHIWHSLALFCSWQRGCHPHQHITGHSQAQTAASSATPTHLRVCWLCIWGLPGLHSSPDRGEGARAELSHAARPGQRPQQGEANPDLPSPRAIKNEAHSAAQLSSDQITASPSSTAGAGNATWTAQHPPAPTPALQAVSPTKINRQVGWQEKAPCSALPPRGETLWQRQQRGEAAAPGGSRRPDRSGMRRPRGGRGGEAI